MDVVALGELLIDFTSRGIDELGYPTMEAHPGGAPANFLAAIAKGGMKTALIAKVGDDSFGHTLIKTLRDNNINTDGIIIDDTVFTTLAFVTLDSNGDREFSFSRKPGADTMLRDSEINYSLIKEARVFHFGTLSLTNEPSRTATIKALEYAKGLDKIISFDPNLRKPLWDDLAKAKKAMLYGLNNSDIIKISDDEVEFLFGLAPEDGIKYIYNTYKPKIIYVTCGENGVYYTNDGINIGFIKSLSNLNVVDTTGAGDIFGGSALYKLLSLNKDINDIAMDDLRDVVEFATKAAGLSTLRPGGISAILSLEEINSYKE